MSSVVELLDLAQPARALPILKRPAPLRAFEVIPLFRVLLADAANVAAPVEQYLIALRADQRRRRRDEYGQGRYARRRFLR